MRCCDLAPRIPRGTGLILLLALTGGCATPQAKLLGPTCRRVHQGDALGALAFTVTVEVEGLLGEQLVYEVSLYNAASKPIRSADKRYRNKAGTVAASKTLMVLQSPCTFENLPLTIPAEELQTRTGDWPLSAKFRLYNTAGECLAQSSCKVPRERAERVATTRPAPAPPERIAATAPPAASAGRRGRPATTQPAKLPAATPETQGGLARGPTATRPAPTAARTDRLASTQPVTPPADEPTRPLPAQPNGLARVGAPGNSSSETVPDVDFVAQIDRLVATSEAWLTRLWPAPGEDSRFLSTGPAIAIDDAPAAQPAALPGPLTTQESPTGEAGASTRRQGNPEAEFAPGPSYEVSPSTSFATTAPASVEQSPGRFRYVVQRGDSLTRIAQRLLGGASRWPEIYNLNRDQLPSPDRLREGMALWVPGEEPPKERE